MNFGCIRVGPSKGSDLSVFDGASGPKQRLSAADAAFQSMDTLPESTRTLTMGPPPRTLPST